MFVLFCDALRALRYHRSTDEHILLPNVAKTGSIFYGYTLSVSYIPSLRTVFGFTSFSVKDMTVI